MQNFNIPLSKLGESIKSKKLDQSLEDSLKELKNEIKEKEKQYKFLQKMKHFLFETDVNDVGKLLKKESFGPLKLFCMYLPSVNYSDANKYRQMLWDQSRKIGLKVAISDMQFYQNTEYEPNDTKLEVALVCQVKDIRNIKLPEGFYFRDFPKTTALVYKYKGPYEYFILIYTKLYQYIESNNLKLKFPAFDIYKYGINTNLSKYDIETKLAFPI